MRSGGIRDAQVGLMHSIERVLLVEGWDEDKRELVAAHVREGGLGPLERFLDKLGVRVHDPLCPEDH
jgi:hypothetical protein